MNEMYNEIKKLRSIVAELQTTYLKAAGAIGRCADRIKNQMLVKIFHGDKEIHINWFVIKSLTVKFIK